VAKPPNCDWFVSVLTVVTVPEPITAFRFVPVGWRTSMMGQPWADGRAKPMVLVNAATANRMASMASISSPYAATGSGFVALAST